MSGEGFQRLSLCKVSAEPLREMGKKDMSKGGF